MASPEHVDFVKKQSFVLDLFGEKRPLSALEISNLYSNFQRNALGVTTLIGFSQAQSKDVTQFFTRGINLAKNHAEKFGKKLKNSNLPVSMTWDTDITTSIEYTFSEKLLMFYTTTLIALSIGFYGLSCSVSHRLDLGVLYTSLTLDIQRFAEDGANLMIKNRWLEEPPMAPDRDELARKSYDES